MNRSQLHLIFFVLVFLGWTVALLVPVPVQAVEMLGGKGNAWYVSKSIHILAYGFITVLGGLLTLSRPIRLALLITLILHGWLTEYVQGYVNRGSSVRDAILDNFGVFLGVLIGWKYYWRELFHSPQPSLSK